MTISKSVSGFSLMACLAVSGCATTGGVSSAPAHDNTDSVLWLQSSTEYTAVTAGIYAAASEALDELTSAQQNRQRSMAIVMDIDETVLDNSRYQGQLIHDDAEYGRGSWDRWVALRSAAAVPGAVDFIRASQSQGVHIAFVTNRPCRTRPNTTDTCPQKADTLANLEAVGIDTSVTTLYLMGERPPEPCRALLTTPEQTDGTWSSDKTSRRACVELDHDILMLFGDQLGDFTEEHAPTDTGRSAAAGFDKNWGRSWFMLPNPTYGGWRSGTPDEKRSLIRGID